SKPASSELLPFDKKMPHFLLVASTAIKSKRQTGAGGRFSGPAAENLHQRRLICACKEPAGDDFGASAFVRGGATASVSNWRAFAGLRCPGPRGAAPASTGSDCRSRGCPQSPPARTSRKLGMAQFSCMTPPPISVSAHQEPS